MKPSTPPTLWIVATPLGNVLDLSPRARACLENADCVLAEDTRRAGLLFQRCGIVAKSFLSLHEHNEQERVQMLVQRLQNGEHLALISDAGLPLIADPGYNLVRACRKLGLPVSVIPGPCAPVTALAGSGIAPQPFAFFGFLPRSEGDQKKLLSPYASLSISLIFFERKDRLASTWANLYAIFGEREVCIARELTKTHEEYLLCPLSEDPPENLLGELTIIVGPPDKDSQSSEKDLRQIIMEEQEEGGTQKDIAKRVQARSMGWTAKAIYKIINEM